MNNIPIQDKVHRPFDKVTTNGMLYGQGKVLSLHNPKTIHDLNARVKRGLYDGNDFVGISLDTRI